jgi:hypothetical protein
MLYGAAFQRKKNRQRIDKVDFAHSKTLSEF